MRKKNERQYRTIKDLSLPTIHTYINLLIFAEEPEHGFTLSRLYADFSEDYTGTKGDLAKKLQEIKKLGNIQVVNRRYWYIPFFA